jgi:MFS family permease
VPVVVVPIVYAATRWVPVAWLAFVTAGFLAVVLYLAGYSAFAAWTKRLQPGGSGIYLACPASVRGGRAVLARVPAVARTSRRHGAGFWLVAAAFLMSMAFSAAPAPLYPVYEQRDGFSTFTVTIVFAVYAVGVVVSLLAAGRISAWVGRKRTLIPALALQVAAAVIFLAWPALPGLLLGRLLTGIGVGIISATATAYLHELHSVRRPGAGPGRFEIVSSVANIGGLGVGPLITGTLAQLVPGPLRVPYIAFAVILTFCMTAVAFAPETAAIPLRRPRYRPQRVSLGQGNRPPTALPSAAALPRAPFSGFLFPSRRAS